MTEMRKARPALKTFITEQTHLVHLVDFATYSKILGRTKSPRSTLPSGSDPGRLAERNLEATPAPPPTQKNTTAGEERFRACRRDHD